MNMAYHVIDREELKAKMARMGRKLQLWNVLPKESFKTEENIPGSKWLPVEILEETLGAVNVRKDEEVVLYCGGVDCTASKTAAGILAKNGFTKILLYEGGLKAWKDAALPLVKLEAR